MTSIGPNAAEGGAADTGAKPVPRQVFLRVAARSWWVVAMGLVLGAVAGLVQARAAPPLYQADVVVVASTTTIPVESFGSLATTAFNTDTVLDPVIRSLRLDTTPHGLIAGRELSVQQVSGAAAIRVIGQASNARLASALANTAAQSFVTAATRSGLGSFTLFGGGAPGTRTPVATTSTVARDALAGVLVSLLLILLLVMWRRPVFSGADVGQELGVDVVVEARVRRAWLRRGSAGSFDIFPRGAALAVWRALDGRSGTSAVVPCVVFVERRNRRDRKLVTMMEDMIAAYWASGNGSRSREPLTWRRASDPQLPAALHDATALVVLVSEGAARRGLRRLEAEIRVAHAPQPAAALLVR